MPEQSFFQLLLLSGYSHISRAPTTAPQPQPLQNIELSAEQDSGLENQLAAQQLSQSWLGRIGKWIEPAFKPLGWDWRVSSAVIAGFPAREVVVAIMETLYSVGFDADAASPSEKLRSASWQNGRLIFTLPMVLGQFFFMHGACSVQPP